MPTVGNHANCDSVVKHATQYEAALVTCAEFKALLTDRREWEVVRRNDSKNLLGAAMNIWIILRRVKKYVLTL